MTGFKSKRESSNIRWLGPYPPTIDEPRRHADEETINHIIDLRNLLRETERQRDNVWDVLRDMERERRVFRMALQSIYIATDDQWIKNKVMEAMGEKDVRVLNETEKRIRKLENDNFKLLSMVREFEKGEMKNC